MIRVRILFGVLFTISVLAFNNCSGGFNAGNTSVSSSNTNSQCRLKVINEAKTRPVSDPSVCEKASNYQCDFRRFRQNVGYEQVVTTQCGFISGLGEFCVPVVIYNFDTSRQLASAEAEDLVEGGAYNRDEASCINLKVVSKGIPVIRGEGSTIEDAIEKSVEECRQRRRL